MARYLKDRRNGELHGYNHEAAKLKYMKEVDSEDEDFNDGQPDPTYVEDEFGFPVAAEPAVGQPAPPTEADILAAAQAGQAALGGDDDQNDEPTIAVPSGPFPDDVIPWALDTNGNRLYEEGTNKPLVYVLSDARNALIEEADGLPMLDVFEEGVVLADPPTPKKKK